MDSQPQFPLSIDEIKTRLTLSESRIQAPILADRAPLTVASEQLSWFQAWTPTLITDN